MLTEKNFNAIWYMIKGGASDDDIMSSQNIAEGTLNRIKKSDGDYAKYKKLHGEEVMKNNKRRNANNDYNRPSTQTIVIQANHYMMEELKTINKTLTLMSNKMTNIMENMESMKEAWK